MLVVTTKIVGTRFRPFEARQAAANLSDGDPLYLELEPENPYDSNAVRVLTKENVFIGYIPKNENSSIAEHLSMMALGKTYTAEVLKTLESGVIYIEVFLLQAPE